MATKERNFISIPLDQIFKRNNNGEFSLFNCDNRVGNTYKYRIPIHQRYYKWKPEKVSKLIDSVMNNYPIGGIIVSKHIKDNKEYYDIEDGQSRLSILQKFYDDKITWKNENNHGILYSELDDSYKDEFKSYMISVEILENFNDSEIHDLFERLQEGEPLKDKDLYWNRSDTKFVKFALELIKKPYWNAEYMGTLKSITDTHRDRLPDVCALISAFTKDENRHITPSFRKHCNSFDKPITSQIESNIKNFLEYYNSIIKGIYELPENSDRRMRPFYNVAKDLGMVLIEWLDNPDMHDNDNDIKLLKTKWIKVISYDMNNNNFMRGKKNLWNGLSSGDKQNTNDSSLRARVERIDDYNNGNYILPE
jgi:hypothetical protein